jgi:hypothetical protein
VLDRVSGGNARLGLVSHGLAGALLAHALLWNGHEALPVGDLSHTVIVWQWLPELCCVWLDDVCRQSAVRGLH